MVKKKSNLCLIAEVKSCRELKEIIEKYGAYVAVIKTHIGGLSDFTELFSKTLKILSREHNVLIFVTFSPIFLTFSIQEDRKFNVSNQVVPFQIKESVFSDKNWANFVNVTPMLLKVMQPSQQDGFVLETDAPNIEGQLSTIQLASEYPWVCGISYENEMLRKDPKLLAFTNGLELYGDIMNVNGNQVLKSENPVETLKELQLEAWNLYLKRTDFRQDQKPESNV